MGALFDNGLSIYVTVVAIILFNVGAWLFLKRLRLCFGDRAAGEITGYVQRMPSKRSSKPVFMPRVRYGCLDHGQQEFVSRMNADPERWPVGTRLPVAYSPTDPSIAEIATPARLWLAPAIFLIFAAALVMTALKA